MFPNISKIIGSGEWSSQKEQKTHILIQKIPTASSYFYLPIDDVLEDDPEFGTKHISWESSNADSQDSDDSDASWSSSSTFVPNDPPEFRPKSKRTSPVIEEVLAEDDLYKVLGIAKTSNIDRLTLRRAYLARSKACHPECVFSFVSRPIQISHMALLPLQ